MTSKDLVLIDPGVIAQLISAIPVGKKLVIEKVAENEVKISRLIDENDYWLEYDPKGAAWAVILAIYEAMKQAEVVR